jgi:hypothetical protein
MPAYDPLNPDTDCFKPPAIPTEVCCLHCGCEYESYLIEWRVEDSDDGQPHGFWCCPTPGCDGRGFGFDILPTDPEYIGEDGEEMWSSDEDDEDDADFDPDDPDEDDDDAEPEFDFETELSTSDASTTSDPTDFEDVIPYDDVPAPHTNRMKGYFDDSTDDLPW